jgi:hypothetical protein
MQPLRPLIWSHDSNQIASRKPGTVHTAKPLPETRWKTDKARPRAQTLRAEVSACAPEMTTMKRGGVRMPMRGRAGKGFVGRGIWQLTRFLQGLVDKKPT